MITPLAAVGRRKQSGHTAGTGRNSADTRGSYDAAMDKRHTGDRFSGGAALAVTAAAVALLAVTMGTRSVFGLFLSPLNSATGLGVATISFAIAEYLPMSASPASTFEQAR